MTDAQAGGTGEALDAEVEVQELDTGAPDPVDTERALADYAQLETNVENAQFKVKQAEAHLEGAQESLRNAEAELAAATKPEASAEPAEQEGV